MRISMIHCLLKTCPNVEDEVTEKFMITRYAYGRQRTINNFDVYRRDLTEFAFYKLRGRIVFEEDPDQYRKKDKYKIVIVNDQDAISISF